MDNKLIILLTFTMAVLTGCTGHGPQLMKNTYMDYSNAYADSSNSQLLLNLARIQNGHPPYFLQLGAVSAQFRLNKSLEGIRSTSAGPISKVLDLTLGISEAPIFHFTPLEGSAFTAVLLKPIDQKLFFALSVKSYPTDLLMRILLDRISFYYPGTEQEITFHNHFLPEEPENYADFLKIASILAKMNDRRELDIIDDGDGNLTFSTTTKAMHVFEQIVEKNSQYRLSNWNLIKNNKTPQIKIHTRTYMGMLIAVTYEYETFSYLAKHEPQILQNLPEIARSAVLKINEDSAYTAPAVAKVNYAGKNYKVSDRPNELRNRQAFALLQLLSTQIALSPDQLPTQQVLQTR